MTEWTDKQKNVIQNRDRNLLVSAAAGSGKTAVLVERIYNKIINKESSIDRLLVVTFTRAAASEMKERVREKLEKEYRETNDKYIENQLSLIHTAHISTIDSFCNDVVRSHFEEVDVDPNFRMADENENDMLKSDIIEEVLSDYFAEGNDDFMRFMEQFSNGKVKNDVPEMIETMYKAAYRQRKPLDWLKECKAKDRITSKEELLETPYISYFIEEGKKLIESYIKEFEFVYQKDIELGIERITEDTKNKILEYYETCNINSISELENIPEKAPTLSFKKGIDNSEKDAFKAIHDGCKKAIKGYISWVKNLDYDEVIKELNSAQDNAIVLVELTEEVTRRLIARKNELGIVDFDDVAHYALDILCKEEDGELEPSKTAESMADEFDEIMIDEYQDSNNVQEAILTSVSKGNNMFMVGDVKQSIYRFRKAEPKLFVNKLNKYEDDLEASNCKIILDDNFRSRKEIIDSVNFIFDYIMQDRVGGIDYKDGHRLRQHADYLDVPEGQNNNTEIVYVECEGSKNDRNQEAKYVAKRIKEITNQETGMDIQYFDTVDGKEMKKYRKAKYKDIVILLRAASNVASYYENALTEEGIPCYREVKTGYYESLEVRTITNLLKVLDNPRQDIPLGAVMTSEMFKFDENDLTTIKTKKSDTDSKDYRYLSLYNCINDYIENGGDTELIDRLIAFENTISKLRKQVPIMTVAELIDEILNVTGFDLYIRALPNGKRRLINIEALKEKAVDYESISFTGLFNFVRYIEKMEYLEKDEGEMLEITEEDDSVCISTIHKSKGLQYPIVFLSDCDSEATTNKDKVIANDDGLIGLDAYDEETRSKSTTIAKEYLKAVDKKENTAERLRLLYVAMTRAQEKLIVTTMVKNGNEGEDDFEKRKEEVLAYSNLVQDSMDYKNIVKSSKFIDWIKESSSRVGHKDASIDIVFQRIEDVEEMATVDQIEAAIEQEGFNELAKKKVPEDIKSILDERFGFTYSYADDVKQHAKLTVTEIKKMTNEEDEDSSRPFDDKKKATDIRVPAFMEEVESEEKLTGAKRGSAYHKVLEHIDMKDFSADKAEKVLNQMLADGHITELERKSVNEAKLAKFAESDLFKRMKAADERGELKKEQPFIMSIPVKEINPDSDSDESVVVQGIIDVCFMEDGRYVIADYKTDRVDDMQSLVNSYHVQLEFYKKALEAASGNEVSELIIYSIELDDQITL